MVNNGAQPCRGGWRTPALLATARIILKPKYWGPDHTSTAFKRAKHHTLRQECDEKVLILNGAVNGPLRWYVFLSSFSKVDEPLLYAERPREAPYCMPTFRVGRTSCV